MNGTSHVSPFPPKHPGSSPHQGKKKVSGLDDGELFLAKQIVQMILPRAEIAFDDLPPTFPPSFVKAQCPYSQFLSACVK